MLAVVCIVCATALFKRQELSRKGFYFDKAIYVVSGVIALFFFVIVSGAAGNGQDPVSIIYKCVLLVASVLIFVLLTYRFKKNC